MILLKNFKLVATAMLAALTCLPQAGPSVDELLSRLSRDELAAEAAGLLSRYKDDPRIIPALRSRFLNSDDKLIKQSIALSMLRMAVADPVYFDYLAVFARHAVDNDAPPAYLSVGRKATYTSLNPEFEEWCRARGLTSAAEMERERSEQARDLLLLVWTRDKRAAPIFRKGLQSNNPMIISESASGLGSLGDPSDIELIVAASDRSPEDIDAGIALALSYFKDSRNREMIGKRLKGSRLYDRFVLAAKASDELDRRTTSPNAKDK